jgi:hypothetical protein
MQEITWGKMPINNANYDLHLSKARAEGLTALINILLCANEDSVSGPSEDHFLPFFEVLRP